LPGAHPSDTVREVYGKLDRPGGALHFEVIDATPVMEEIHSAIPGSELVALADARHGPACGRALRAFLDRRAPSAA
jgi:hypothetical protein